MATFLSKERSIAGPDFNRWFIPPCALATHLCIGQAYAISVFNLPLTRQLGIHHSVAGDWKLTELGWIFTIAIFVLGASAALFGSRVQAAGPRKSGFVAALCWGTGFLIGALGIRTHQLWLVVAFFANLAVRPVSERFVEPSPELSTARPSTA